MRAWQMQNQRKQHTYATFALSNTKKIYRITRSMDQKTRNIWRSENAFGLDLWCEIFIFKDFSGHRKKDSTSVCNARTSENGIRISLLCFPRLSRLGPSRHFVGKLEWFTYFGKGQGALLGLPDGMRRSPGEKKGAIKDSSQRF